MKQFFSKTAFAVALFAGIVTFNSCKKDEEITGFGNLEVYFDHVVNGSTFALGTNYVNASGETMNFSQFDYYVSNFVLVKEDGSEHVVPKDSCYFLVKTSSTSSRTVTLKNVPAGNYKEVKFIIGVDSLKSTRPATERTGVLDPAGEGAGMYWMWNSGYIFVKAEGTSPQAPLDAQGHNTFRYHIGLFGGYSTPTLNNIKSVTLHDHANHENATVRTNITPELHVQVDVMEMFKSPTAISVAANPVVMVTPYSATVANNYADMFELHHIHN